MKNPTRIRAQIPLQKIAASALLIAFLMFTANGQTSSSGSLSITVRDAHGAVLAGVTVKVTNQAKIPTNSAKMATFVYQRPHSCKPHFA